MKKLIYTKLHFFMFLLISILFNSSYSYSDNEYENNIIFNWSFGALIKQNNKNKIISINDNTELKTGDKLKMMIKTKSESFVYILYHGSNNEIMILYPEYQKESYNYSDEKYYIPAGNLWFSLDEHTGRETFYLIVSKKRLENLEILINRYQASSFEEKSNIVSQIVEEIKNVKRKHKKFTAKAERPIPIGGSIRGSKNQPPSVHDISDFEVEITATDFYSRTFTIEHK